MGTKLLAAVAATGIAGWLTSRTAQAEEFAVVGARAMGMGGAGVAVTRGGLSSYWNPAGLAAPKSPRVDTFWDLSLQASAGYTATPDTLGEIDDVVALVEEIDFDQLEADLEASSQLSATQLQQILRLAEEIPDLAERGTGLLTTADVGLDFRIGRFGFSALGLVHAGGVTNVDLTSLALGDVGLGPILGPGGNTPATVAGQDLADSLASRGLATQTQADELVFQAEQAGVNVSNPAFQDFVAEILQQTADNAGGGGGDLFSANESGADLRAVLLEEYGIGYSQPLFGLVSVGATAKLMYGTTVFEQFTLRRLGDFDDILGELADGENREESVEFGLDLGVLVQPVDWISVGVVARNINEPEFDFEGPGRYQVDRQLRGGVGVRPFGGLILALDLDLLKNETDALPGFESQIIGGGIEYPLLDVLFLRLGASANLADENEAPVIHGGLGLRIARVQIDAAVMVSTEFSDIDTDGDSDSMDAPEKAGLSLFIGVNVPLP
jgi:hypothetical protein